MAEKINRENFERKVLGENKIVLLDFYSDSCVPCKRMSPILAELEEVYGENLLVGKVNIAYERELAEEYEVSAAPTILFLKKGVLIDRRIGVIKKAELETLISKNIESR